MTVRALESGRTKETCDLERDFRLGLLVLPLPLLLLGVVPELRIEWREAVVAVPRRARLEREVEVRSLPGLPPREWVEDPRLEERRGGRRRSRGPGAVETRVGAAAAAAAAVAAERARARANVLAPPPERLRGRCCCDCPLPPRLPAEGEEVRVRLRVRRVGVPGRGGRRPRAVPEPAEEWESLELERGGEGEEEIGRPDRAEGGRMGVRARARAPGVICGRGVRVGGRARPEDRPRLLPRRLILSPPFSATTNYKCIRPRSCLNYVLLFLIIWRGNALSI
jgi:hypothetical protein